MAEYMSPTILSAKQVQQVAGVPVIGFLPPLDDRLTALETKRDENARILWQSASVALSRALTARPAAQQSGAVPSILVISSEKESDTRGQCAHLFAFIAAERGDRVLMVDATGARQSTSEGLSEVLRGERSLDNVAHSEPGSGIAVMSAGRRWHSALGAGESTFAERMLSDARRNYDLVVIDGGTITLNSNLEALARRMDVVIFVGTLGNTLQKDLIAANDAAARMGDQDLSVLLVSNPAVANLS